MEGIKKIHLYCVCVRRKEEFEGGVEEEEVKSSGYKAATGFVIPSTARLLHLYLWYIIKDAENALDNPSSTKGRNKANNFLRCH